MRKKGASEKQSSGTAKESLYRAWYGREWERNRFGIEWAKELETMYLISKERGLFFKSGRGTGIASRFQSERAFSDRLGELKDELAGCAAEAIETGTADKLRSLADGLESQFKLWRKGDPVDRMRAAVLTLCFDPVTGQQTPGWTMPKLKRAIVEWLNPKFKDEKSFERQLWRIVGELNCKLGNRGRPKT